MILSKLSIKNTEAIYYTERYRILLNSVIHLIKNNNLYSSTNPIPHTTLDMYKGDLIGLLLNIGVPSHLHWTVLRLNGFRSTTKVIRSMASGILIPNTQYLESIVSKIRHKG